eukprot:gnl/Dysnectes_brevis/4778_a6586_523.p1 GENE.gnl/Dysnectes_brevis/4778_a6586_523~~gnl/Dysnectes_brevis/4778_a6586_523.p1  ORF type:complete len:315 (-),score=30.51 gnl/Dysnectes_brevis/4778_a6586_523:27-971(-)
MDFIFNHKEEAESQLGIIPLWHQLKERIPIPEREECERIIGRDLIEETEDLYRDALLYLDIFLDQSTDLDDKLDKENAASALLNTPARRLVEEHIRSLISLDPTHAKPILKRLAQTHTHTAAYIADLEKPSLTPRERDPQPPTGPLRAVPAAVSFTGPSSSAPFTLERVEEALPLIRGALATEAREMRGRITELQDAACSQAARRRLLEGAGVGSQRDMGTGSIPSIQQLRAFSSDLQVAMDRVATPTRRVPLRRGAGILRPASARSPATLKPLLPTKPLGLGTRPGSARKPGYGFGVKSPSSKRRLRSSEHKY